MDSPIAIAPTAMQRMAHPEGELATARGKSQTFRDFNYLFSYLESFFWPAAGKCNTIYTMSTLSTSSIEEVAQAAPDTSKFFQLYIYKDRELTKKLVRRAETAGFKALVLTVDAPVFGPRRSDIRNKFQLPSHLRWVRLNLRTKPRSFLNRFSQRSTDWPIFWMIKN